MAMQAANRPRWLGLGFAVTVFLSAFLLFQIQPLVGKFILPWFGGAPAVWTTCMLFFQVLLVGGYAYAHFALRMPWRKQVALHVALIVAAVVLAPIAPGVAWKPSGSEAPALRILALLLVSVGLPYFVLSSTGPLLQSWFSQTYPGRSPYRLYALSNIGSLLALVSYPFVFEAALSSGAQAMSWRVAFAVFGVCCAVCAGLSWRAAPKAPIAADPRIRDDAQPPSSNLRLMWFALAMVPSVLLLATTNQVCLDVAAVPFLWVLPLALYLTSFILCFDSERWYSRKMFAAAMAICLGCVSLIMLQSAAAMLVAQVVVYFAALFFCCMVCHGELASLKPHPRYLTSFYLTLAAGGAVGGLFVGLAAPLIFPAYLELHLGLAGCAMLILVVCFRDRRSALYRGKARAAWLAMALGMAWLSIMLSKSAWATFDGSLAISRNFYGVLRVRESHEGGPCPRGVELLHGAIVHGAQFSQPDKRRLPTTYYGEKSGVGLALANVGVAGKRRVGVIGLGVGTLAAYGRRGDVYRFYEINPEVAQFAKSYFTYLRDSAAKTEIVLGDARLSLEHESPRRFDVLVLDAFSGDAVPTHLLTREAMRGYLRHLAPRGALAIHFSNLHFDLRPVIAGLAEEFGLSAVVVESGADRELGTSLANWALLARSAETLEFGVSSQAAKPLSVRPLYWTDDRCNLFEIMR